MTDDTDTGDEAGDRARSLPLIDTFAALEAELAAKEDRIERLEAELADGYLEPTAADPEMATDGEGLAEGGKSPDEEPPEEEEPRSHEDWEPETDPLEDTGAVDADGDHEGVTAQARGAASTADSEPSTESTDEQAATPDEPSTDSGLQPVRTAGRPAESAGESASGSATDFASESAGSTSPSEAVDATEAADADAEFGVTMETSSNLTGGSLGSSASAGEGSAASGSTAEESTDSDAGGGSSRPDPTADRGERLSLLVRRAELRDEDAVVETFVRGIERFDDVTREMLAHYRETGDAAPVDAHVAAGGSGERQYAYARNRTLRKAGIIEHDGAGRYRYALPSLVEEAFDGHAEGETLADTVAAIEDSADLD